MQWGCVAQHSMGCDTLPEDEERDEIAWARPASAPPMGVLATPLPQPPDTPDSGPGLPHGATATATGYDSPRPIHRLSFPGPGDTALFSGARAADATASEAASHHRMSSMLNAINTLTSATTSVCNPAPRSDALLPTAQPVVFASPATRPRAATAPLPMPVVPATRPAASAVAASTSSAGTGTSLVHAHRPTPAPAGAATTGAPLRTKTVVPAASAAPFVKPVGARSTSVPPQPFTAPASAMGPPKSNTGPPVAFTTSFHPTTGSIPKPVPVPALPPLVAAPHVPVQPSAAAPASHAAPARPASVAAVVSPAPSTAPLAAAGIDEADLLAAMDEMERTETPQWQPRDLIRPLKYIRYLVLEVSLDRTEEYRQRTASRSVAGAAASHMLYAHEKVPT